MEKETNLKYIVYCTLNKVNNKIYIGVHETFDPTVFDGYLGCGVINTQPHTYEKAKTVFQLAVKKYGSANFTRSVLYIFNNLEEAYEKEAEIVDAEFLKRNDVYNTCLGGMGGVWQPIKVFKYSEDGYFLESFDSFKEAAYKHSLHESSISIAVRKKIKIKGFYWSTDKLNNLDLSLYNLGINQNQKISCYDKSGKFIKVFNSIEECKNELNTSRLLILTALHSSLNKHGYYYSFVQAETYDKANKIYKENRPVYKYDKFGIYITEFTSQIEAEKIEKFSISKFIRFKTSDKNGNLWSTEKLEVFNSNKTTHQSKQVRVLTLNNKEVELLNSATQAAKKYGNAVWHTLSGRNNTHKGLKFEYL